jgi:ABC-type transport system substrate-binding protein
VRYSNAKVSDLAATAKKEQDPAKRDALYKEITKLVMDDVPFVMLVQPKSYVGLNPAIQGYVIHPIWFVTLAHLSR